MTNSTVKSIDVDPLTITQTISTLKDRVKFLAEEKKSQITPFRLKVWAVCSSVPLGNVTTYKAIADVLGIGSPRAVGQALRNNPFSPFVPCHRVVNTKGDLHGFGGETSPEALNRKHTKLSEESVEFVNPLKVSSNSFCVLRMKNQSFC